MTVVARAGAGVPIGAGMRGALRSLDPLVPGFDVQSMNDVVSLANSGRRFNTMLLTLLGFTGLVLAAIGISGVISFFVSQRTQEFGIRVALGATVGNVMALVVRQALDLAVAGVTAGGLLAWWMTRSLQSMLFQVEPRDPVVFAAGAAVLILVAVAAASLPARRAAKLDPTKALTG
jgi:ABC-type antimicrobial peptide transport system permease subunit